MRGGHIEATSQILRSLRKDNYGKTWLRQGMCWDSIWNFLSKVLFWIFFSFCKEVETREVVLRKDPVAGNIPLEERKVTSISCLTMQLLNLSGCCCNTRSISKCVYIFFRFFTHFTSHCNLITPLSLFFLIFLLAMPSPWYVEVSWSRIKSMPQQQPEPQQWQCWILNLLILSLIFNGKSPLLW